MSASMAEGIAEVLAEHRIYKRKYEGSYCAVCGEVPATLTTNEHQADALAANGYGKLEDAWDEGYTTGNAHNGRRDANPHRKEAGETFADRMARRSLEALHAKYPRAVTERGGE